MDLLADPFRRKILNVALAEGDDAASRIIQFSEEGTDGGFPGAGSADDISQVAGGEKEGDIVEDKSVWSTGICEGNLSSEFRT